MYQKRRYKKQRKQKGKGLVQPYLRKGLLLGSDWPKLSKNLQPYLRKKKKLGKGAVWDAFKKSWNSVLF